MTEARRSSSGDPQVHEATPPTTAMDDLKKDISHVERVLSPNDKDAVDYSRVDNELQEYANRGRVEIDEATSRMLRRKIDRRVLVIMILTYFLQALDKGTMSFASIMGIREDNNLHGQQYSWLTTCIYIAVLIVEYPTNWILQRVPIAKYLGINIILWGSVLALHAACHNFVGLVVVRTLLGIFEAVCQPSFVILSGMWYKREEQAATVTYWYMMNGGQQIVGGLLAYCFSLIGKDKAIHSWQAIFIAYGCLSVLWGLFVLYWMPDSPMRAKCFTEEEKHLMVERVRANQTGMQNKQFRSYQMWEAFRDPQMWCYCAIQVFTTLPTSGLGSFANIIITGFNFTELQTQLLAMVLGFYIIVVLMSSAWLVKKTNQNLLIMLGFIIPSFVGTIVLMTVENKNLATKAGLLISYYITLSFWSAQGLCLSMVSRNIAGATKKSTVVAATFVSWAVGNAIGPQVFLAKDAPRYFIAFGVHLGCYSAMTLAVIFLRFYLIAQNKKKERMLQEAGVNPATADNLDHAFEDRTDQENLHFRYIY
ncbi:major facilitator superfamily domain-containing protein [Aspergillus pseudonomiae]|uniref:Major facilitator superfamily domain-containing protein n=1 Tax=Aspergillus pseudonomiae TaxID=1506151 RepID=A0A5N7DQ77_9EURO|nr:major facilitator superfamily domain-containing protein [Aspergillus pseudonomiae]KAB8263601.1 major facilitator superfamily domain-containing protein [Aspergillus pseudonomiae]KAE8408465.1 major facilitator superfamily domain-containing protein [Aspergillus pseudonomiae]